MSAEWQTWAALAVVGMTAVIMIYRVLGRGKTGGSSGCGCAKPAAWWDLRRKGKRIQ